MSAHEYLGNDYAAGAKPTNVLLVLADDMGYSDLGCYGGEIRTPHLDRLARGGARFTQFYNTARCSPSRASLLTGLHPHQTGIGILTNDDGPGGYPGSLNDRCATMAEVLAANGYITGISGKWHLSAALWEPAPSWPTRRGFRHSYGTISGCGSYFAPATLRRGEDDASCDCEDPEFFYTDAIAEDAAAFIGEACRSGRPFFSYVAFTAPHWPLHAPQEDIDGYDGVYDAGWDELRVQRMRRLREEGLLGPEVALSDRDPTQPAWADVVDKQWEVARMQAYAAQVERMDRGVGRILRALEDGGCTANTLIIFLSDNGACAESLPQGDPAEFAAKRWMVPAGTRDGRELRIGNDPAIVPGAEDTYASYGQAWANLSNTPFRFYKRWVHEGGIATPLIICWPDGPLTPGAVVDQPFQLTDVLPTVLEATACSYVDAQGVHPLEGRSMMPALRGERLADVPLYWEHIGNAAVRRDRWKLVREYPHPWELYDVVEDRTELTDLAAARPEVVADLSAEYQRWADRVGVIPRRQILDIYDERRRQDRPVLGG